jgi:hypothetical protein
MGVAWVQRAERLMVPGVAGCTPCDRSLRRCMQGPEGNYAVSGMVPRALKNILVPTRPPLTPSGFCGKLINFYVVDVCEWVKFRWGGVAWVQDSGTGKNRIFCEVWLKNYPSGNVMKRKRVLVERLSSGSRHGYRRATRSISKRNG